MDKGGGEYADIKLIRSVEWLCEQRAVEGGLIHLDMREMGTYGPARVISIDPLPPMEDGPGRLVTGWFRHSSAVVGDLIITGEPEPLGVTPTHPVWSEDRKDWVPVCELKKGERLKTINGETATVVSYTIRGKPEPVYNIEVEVDHCYHVGEQGLLVHNASVLPERLEAAIQRYELRERLQDPMLKPGPGYPESWPASNPDDYTLEEWREVDRIGRLYGDHHDRSITDPGQARWTPDHQPVTELVRLAEEYCWFKDLLKEAKLPTTLRNQRLYPHSRTSFRQQGGKVTAIKLKVRAIERLVE
jgi:hypothetical protein